MCVLFISLIYRHDYGPHSCTLAHVDHATAANLNYELLVFCYAECFNSFRGPPLIEIDAFATVVRYIYLFNRGMISQACA